MLKAHKSHNAALFTNVHAHALWWKFPPSSIIHLTLQASIYESFVLGKLSLRKFSPPSHLYSIPPHTHT